MEKRTREKEKVEMNAYRLWSNEQRHCHWPPSIRTMWMLSLHAPTPAYAHHHPRTACPCPIYYKRHRCDRRLSRNTSTTNCRWQIGSMWQRLFHGLHFRWSVAVAALPFAFQWHARVIRTSHPRRVRSYRRFQPVSNNSPASPTEMFTKFAFIRETRFHSTFFFLVHCFDVNPTYLDLFDAIDIIAVDCPATNPLLCEYSNILLQNRIINGFTR